MPRMPDLDCAISVVDDEARARKALRRLLRAAGFDMLCRDFIRKRNPAKQDMGQHTES